MRATTTQISSSQGTRRDKACSCSAPASPRGVGACANSARPYHMTLLAAMGRLVAQRARARGALGRTTWRSLQPWPGYRFRSRCPRLRHIWSGVAVASADRCTERGLHPDPWGERTGHDGLSSPAGPQGAGGYRRPPSRRGSGCVLPSASSSRGAARWPGWRAAGLTQSATPGKRSKCRPREGKGEGGRTQCRPYGAMRPPGPPRPRCNAGSMVLSWCVEA